MAKKKTANVMDLLGAQAKKKTPAKKKSEMPVLELEDTPQNRQLIDTWHQKKKDEKEAKALKEKQEAKLKPLAASARNDYCLNNKFHKTVKVRVGDSQLVTASFQSKMSAIDTDSQEELEKIFGDHYSTCFQLITNIKLTEAAMEQVERDAAAGKPSVINKIMDALGGPEQFAAVFEVTQEIKPREAFFERHIVDPDVSESAKVATARGLIKVQKPSLSQ